MANITVKINLKKDAWNWWDACNKVSYGVDWKERIDENIWREIHQKTLAQAELFLIPYLKKYYKERQDHLTTTLSAAQNLFNPKAGDALAVMETVTSHPLYRNTFPCFLTTFPRNASSYQKGFVWLHTHWPVTCYLGYFLHELLHFQFIHYYQALPKVRALNERQFHELKESLTVILNDE